MHTMTIVYKNNAKNTLIVKEKKIRVLSLNDQQSMKRKNKANVNSQNSFKISWVTQVSNNNHLDRKLLMDKTKSLYF